MGVIKCYVPQSDALYHHGTVGMHWGQRNGPPYPLNTFQRRLDSSIQKGKRVLGKAASDAGARVHRQVQEAAETNRARRQEIRERKRNAAERERLTKMSKKHPDWLTDDEIRMLQTRADNEARLAKANESFVRSQMSEIMKQSARDIVTPTAIALGKAFVVSTFVDNDSLESISSQYVKKAFNYSKEKNDKDNDKDKDKGGKGKGKTVTKTIKSNNKTENKRYSLITIDLSRNKTKNRNRGNSPGIYVNRGGNGNGNSNNNNQNQGNNP